MSNRNRVLILTVIGAFVIFVAGVPIVEVQVQEEYTESVPYDVQVAYTATEPQTEILGSITSPTLLQAGYYSSWDGTIEADTNVRFTVTADDTLTVMILTFDQFCDFIDGDSYDYERKVEDTKTASLNYITSSETYYFVIENRHSRPGVFGDIVIISDMSITATSTEEVTRYRTETEYRVETKYRTVTKKVTIIAMITGSY
jgi:hypothetical protein